MIESFLGVMRFGIFVILFQQVTLPFLVPGWVRDLKFRMRLVSGQPP